jgi:CheY-like chemotaxis protein
LKAAVFGSVFVRESDTGVADVRAWETHSRVSGRAVPSKGRWEQTRDVRVLLVDDELSILRVCSLVLRNVAEVTAVSTVADAHAALEQHRFEVALVDLHLEAMAGEDLLRELAERWPDTRRVAFTASPTTLKDASLVERVLEKPFSNEALVRTVFG